MAKPKSASSSATSLHTPSHPPRYTSPPPQPSSSARQANILAPRPSATLLALLATVAASTSAADGRPLEAASSPPDFLCPLFSSSDSSLDCTTHPQHTPLHDDDAAPDPIYLAPTPTRKRRRRSGFVPDKYQQGDDGRWRKVPSWSLYGSTVCECSDDSRTPQPTAPEIDDQIDPTQVAPPTTNYHHPTTTDMTADLPPGWKAASQKKDISPYILTMSIILAIFICGTIFGCVGWRRKRRNHALRDVEKRQRKLKMLEDDNSIVEPEELKRARSQQRLWAKASAKWKASIRTYPRRRKKRPSASVTHDVDPRMSSDSLASRFSYANTVMSVSTAADDTSLHSRPASNDTIHGGDVPRDAHSTNSAGVANLDASRPSQPPRYVDNSASFRADTQLPALERSTACGSGDTTAPGGVDATLHVDTSSLDEIPYVATAAAHIATDDKMLLSRMADLASSPPTEPGSSYPDPSHVQSFDSTGPSVPVLDEFDDVPVGLHALEEHIGCSTNSAQPSSYWARTIPPSPEPNAAANSLLDANHPAPIYSRDPSPHLPLRGLSLFPDPPSKSHLSARLFYDYPSSFEEDVEGIDPLPIPSAPPFDFAYSSPSAPPVDDMDTPVALPCAPPLIDEEDVQLECSNAHSSTSSATPPEETHMQDIVGGSVSHSIGDDCTPCACQPRPRSGQPCSCIPSSPTRASTSSIDLPPSDGSSARGRPPSRRPQARTVNPPDYLP